MTVWAMIFVAPAWAAGAPADGHAAPEPAVAAVQVPQRTRDPAELSGDVGTGPGPAEAPPPGFAGAQYVDSAGCVFLNLHGQWQPRVARDESVMCGYPPTLSARRTLPDTVAPLFPAPPEPRAARMERVLSETIIGNLQDGELSPAGGTASARPTQAPAASLPAPVAPAAGGPAGLAAAVRAAPVLRGAMAAPQRDRPLCRLLGASAGAESLRLGQQMALGLCGAAPLAFPQLASAPVAAPALVAIRADSVATPPAARLPKGAKAGGRDKAAPRAVRPTAAGTRAAPLGRGMVPPGARFVQLGAYADAPGADRAAQRLARLGLPVSRAREMQAGRAVQLILAGPFDGREAVVRAIDRLRRAGYADAFAR